MNNLRASVSVLVLIVPPSIVEGGWGRKRQKAGEATGKTTSSQRVFSLMRRSGDERPVAHQHALGRLERHVRRRHVSRHLKREGDCGAGTLARDDNALAVAAAARHHDGLVNEFRAGWHLVFHRRKTRS